MSFLPNKIDFISQDSIDHLKRKHQVKAVTFGSISFGQLDGILDQEPIPFGDLMNAIHQIVFFPIIQTEEDIQVSIRIQISKRLGEILSRIDGKPSMVLKLIAEEIILSFERIRSAQEFTTVELELTEIVERFKNPIIIASEAFYVVKSKVEMFEGDSYLRNPNTGAKEMYYFLYKLGIIDYLTEKWETDGNEKLLYSEAVFTRLLTHITGWHDPEALRYPIRKHVAKLKDQLKYYNPNDKEGKKVERTIEELGIQMKTKA